MSDLMENVFPARLYCQQTAQCAMREKEPKNANASPKIRAKTYFYEARILGRATIVSGQPSRVSGISIQTQ